VPPEIAALKTDPPWMLLMKACGYDANGNELLPPPTYADASGGAPRAAPGVASDAGTKPYLYETWWGFCPVVGSANQLFWGRTPFQKVCGGFFLVLDCTMVAPVARGMFFGLRAASTAALRLAARGAGTVLQREALKEFAVRGGQVLLREQAEALITRQLTNGHVLMVGAETSANAVNHSVAYIFEQGTGKIMKLHGGITQLAKWEGEYVSKATIQSTVGRMNTMQVFNLAKSPAEVMTWWSKMAGSNAFSSFWRAGIPRGCTGTSVLILEQLAKEGAITGVPIIRGAARWMPLYLDRTLGGYVLNPMNIWRGTVAQGAMAAFAPVIMREATSMAVGGPGLPQSYDPDWSDMLPNGIFAPVSSFYQDSALSMVDSVLAMPTGNIVADISQFQYANREFPPAGLNVNLPPPYVRVEAPAPPQPPTVETNSGIAGTWFQGTNTTSKRVFTKRPGDDYWVGTNYLFHKDTYNGAPYWHPAGTVELRDLGNGYFSYYSGSNRNAPRWKLTGGTLQELNLDGKTPLGSPWHR
jgi:hypothetical protein